MSRKHGDIITNNKTYSFAYSDSPRGKSILKFSELLEKEGFKELKYEVMFDWLFIPTKEELVSYPDEKEVKNNLINHAKKCKDFLKKAEIDLKTLKGRNKKILIEPDCVLENLMRKIDIDIMTKTPRGNIILIEFDEKQHFSEERKISLESYKDIKGLNFNVEEWKEKCSESIYDCDPPGRDWHRAYRDAIRDLRCKKEGVILLRAHIDMDENKLRSVLKNY